MTIWCWSCNRQCPEGEFVEIARPKTRLWTGHRVKMLKHRRCKAETIVLATAAKPAGKMSA